MPRKTLFKNIKKEAFELFQKLLKTIKYQVISKLSTITIVDEPVSKPVIHMDNEHTEVESKKVKKDW